MFVVTWTDVNGDTYVEAFKDIGVARRVDPAPWAGLAQLARKEIVQFSARPPWGFDRTVLTL